MKIYIKQAIIFDRASNYHKARKDVVIENGMITEIGDHLIVDNVDRTIESSNLHLSPSWVDIKANFCDPGNEHKEDLNSGSKVALAGGFGHVFLTGNNNPVTDSKAQVKYIENYNLNGPLQMHAIGSITEKMESKQLTEMYDMYQNGVRMFSDGSKSLPAGVLQRALLYAQNFDGLVVSFPQNASIVSNGQVNEGIASIKTGLKGIPSIGEIMQVQRDLNLLNYTGGKIHFSGISTKESVDLIRKAKLDGMNVTADVYVNHLIYVEEDLLDFDTNHKVLPPYRRKTDRDALWNGLAEGVIDCIASNHEPQNTEEKFVEFDNASFGSISLQTFYGSLSDYFDQYHELIIDKITTQPRRLVNLPVPFIEIGETANLTIFDPSITWEYNRLSNHSKSNNSSLFEKPIKGKALAVIKGGFSQFN
jgi:dihydroorotase